MKTWTNEKTGITMCEPDCVDEYLSDIWAIGVDYDGYNTVEGLKNLVDELVDMAKKARECLWENKLFGIHGSPIQLLNCPICGRKVEIHGGSEEWTPTFYDPDSGGDPYYIHCECGIEFCIGYCEATELANAWNTRK